MWMVDTPLCLSGGAPGADLQFGMNAGRASHQVIHWSFDGHKTDAPQQEVVVLTEDQLNKANESLKEANKVLKRNIPWKKPWILKLLQRNYYQVRWSGSVYAVASTGRDKDGNVYVKGGTAWAVQMFFNMNNHFPQTDRRWLYLFDQNDEQWLKCDGGSLPSGHPKWEAIDRPEVPTGVYAGIGSRDLTEAGKHAIRDLYARISKSAWGYTTPEQPETSST